jgi:hypothetical protein
MGVPVMLKWISAAAGACGLGLASLQSLSTAAVLGAGLVAASPTLISGVAQADVLPGWRRPCSFCMYTWRGGAPFRNGGQVAPGAGGTYSNRTNTRGRITMTNERTYFANGRTYVVRTKVVRTYSVRPER